MFFLCCCMFEHHNRYRLICMMFEWQNLYLWRLSDIQVMVVLMFKMQATRLVSCRHFASHPRGIFSSKFFGRESPEFTLVGDHSHLGEWTEDTMTSPKSVYHRSPHASVGLSLSPGHYVSCWYCVGQVEMLAKSYGNRFQNWFNC